MERRAALRQRRYVRNQIILLAGVVVILLVAAHLNQTIEMWR